ncbi:MAG: hypothetical protein R8G66_30990 [Cytophagales bacterium]|nr:hypothetical protein [Cytophagales bacterium]
MPHIKEMKDEYLWKNNFQHVCLYFPILKSRGEYAKPFFHHSISTIEEIESDDEGNYIFLRTNLFWISLADALQSGEIEVYQGPANKSIEEIDASLIDDLEFFEKEYLKSRFEILERENNKNHSYSLGFYEMRNARKWS